MGQGPVTPLTCGHVPSGGMTRGRSGRRRFDEFLSTRRFSEIDGLRAIAITFVLAGHMVDDPVLEQFHGIGVPLFLVNSGFLITMLLLREERRNGRIDLRGFYIRRAFRLLPVYYLALAAFSLMVAAGLAQNAGNWGQRLLFFLTFNNEFASGATFSHTWTLAVQEKFYIVWPLLTFAAVSARRIRLWGTPALVMLLLGVWAVAPGNYSRLYIPLLIGCALALAAHTPRGFGAVSQLGRPTVFAVALALAVAVHVWLSTQDRVSVPFSLAAGLLVPGLVFGHERLRRLVGCRPLSFVGLRTYSIYLFHPVVISVVDLALPVRAGSPWWSLLRFLLVLAGSIAGAAISYRFIERPANQFGHRLTKDRTPIGAVPAASGGTDGRDGAVGPAVLERPVVDVQDSATRGVAGR